MSERRKIVIVNNNIVFAKQLEMEILKYFDEDIIILRQYNREYIVSNNIDLLVLDFGREWRGVSAMQEAIKIREYKHWDIEIILISHQIDVIYNLIDAKSLYFVYKEQWKKHLPRVLQALNRKKFRENYMCTIEGHTICIRDLIFIYAYDNIVYFHMRGNKIFSIKANLDNIEEELNKSKCCRIHKWYIVNMVYIKRKYSDTVILWNNISLPISDSYQQKFKAVYKVAKMKEII
jgi:DNA-binding LytR/AlgR family response regulator